MRLLLVTAALAAALALPGAAGAQGEPYWRTIDRCDHGHPSRVSYRVVGLLLRHVRPAVDRERVRHYTRCVATRAKRRAIVRKAVKPGWRWRSSYPQKWAILTNRHYSDLLGYLAALRWCESTNDPTAVSPDGLYRGWYQFSFSTWRTVGGSGDPADAAREEQTYRAAVLLRTGGPGHWPNCP
jgi:hypothetical protein